MSSLLEPDSAHLTAVANPRPPAGAPGDHRSSTGSSIDGEPTWEIVTLFPRQGDWTIPAYEALSSETSIEFVDGRLEFRAMPELAHQLIVLFLARLLQDFLRGSQRPAGVVAIAPFSIQVRDNVIRQPDIAWLAPDRLAGNRKPVQGADLVMEVVSASPEDRHRDYFVKREDYAAAGIPEYWIVDPAERVVSLLVLEQNGSGESRYIEAGRFAVGSRVRSHRLPGFEVLVTDCFAAADEANQ